jgi:CheY-like chemotaxis protein
VPRYSSLKNNKLPRRVLLVEDHSSLRQLWKEMLCLHGYEADTAADGREALDKIAEHSYDAIISDVHMPVLSGLGLFYACRKRFPKAADRMIFITGAWYADSEDLCRETGRPYLLKSFVWENLNAALQQVLETNEAGPLENLT